MTPEFDTGQQEDTIAQKPADTRAGTPLTPPAIGADLDQENPTPGAQPPLEEEAAKTTGQPKVAAGLPAVYETTRFAVGEMGLKRWAKAVADEGTTKRVTPDFFREQISTGSARFPSCEPTVFN